MTVWYFIYCVNVSPCGSSFFFFSIHNFTIDTHFKLDCGFTDASLGHMTPSLFLLTRKIPTPRGS